MIRKRKEIYTIIKNHEYILNYTIPSSPPSRKQHCGRRIVNIRRIKQISSKNTVPNGNIIFWRENAGGQNKKLQKKLFDFLN